ncbi:MAG: CRISPR-associated endonuclease Cas2 [Erysipelotrichaceae bacterium]|nr:CRISPR-associated endonuclease Cas2 [Erysipelotrichaceae bacterium]
MRIMVMFDLPTKSTKDHREYTRFRKFLLKNGFMMLQESVYCKLTLNQTIVESLAESIRRNKPEEGLVEIFSLTEKQFSKIEFIIGELNTDVLNDDKRLVVL